MLAGFLAAVRGLDPDDLDQRPLASRLCWAAFRAGQAPARSMVVPAMTPGGAGELFAAACQAMVNRAGRRLS